LGIPISAGMGMGTGKNRSRRTLVVQSTPSRIFYIVSGFSEIVLREFYLVN